jgi:hypothetical protein
LSTSRWYSLNVHAFRAYYPANTTFSGSTQFYVFDFTNASLPVIDNIYSDEVFGVTTTPVPIGRKFGKVLSQFNLSYLSTSNIVELNSGPIGEYYVDFLVTFH